MHTLELEFLVVEVKSLKLSVHHLDLGPLEEIVLDKEDFVLCKRTEFATEYFCVLELTKRRSCDEQDFPCEVAS